MTIEQAAFAFHAWVDESIHVAAGFYMVAAAVADPTQCQEHRDTARALATSTRRRIHWRDEEDKDKLRIAEALGRLDLAHTIVVASPIDPRKQERARRKCLERLLPHLEAAGVSHAWFETRTAVLNRRDLHMVDAMRGAGTLVGSLHIDFDDPNTEPMLWIPDSVAGAVGAARRGDATYRTAFAAPIEEIEVEL